MVNDEDFDAAMAKELERELERAKSSVVVVLNLPKVDDSKYDKLKAIVTKLFAKLGPVRKPESSSVVLPRKEKDGVQMSLGCAFVAYENPSIAGKVVTKVHQQPGVFPGHTLSVHTLPDVERVASLPETFVEGDGAAGIVDITGWLLDKRGRNQFVTFAGDETEVFWFDAVTGYDVDHGRFRWTDFFVQWSPKGSYLATTHQQGVALWGGPQCQTKIIRFAHDNVSLINFSPNEKYLVTSNAGRGKVPGGSKDPEEIIIWDIASGKKLRSFPAEVFESKICPIERPEDEPLPTVATQWPVFKWSHDDKFIARVGEDVISIYSTPDMGLLDKKSTKAPGVRSITWSPTDNFLAYWTPEFENSPARVSLVEFPSRREIRQKALYSVAGIRLHWQESGNFFCAKVDRLTKSKKGQFTNFELFRIKAKDIPIETLEYLEKDRISAFAWEPVGSRFGVIHGDAPGRSDVSFFSMEGVDGQLKKLQTLEKKTANALFWSPQGGICLMAGMGAMSGVLEWYNVADQESIATGDHYLCTDVQWDPSGRFVATSVSAWRQRSETGVVVWSILGKELGQMSKEQFKQFLWRPRPPSLLTGSAVKKVKKDLKNLREKFEKEDDELRESRRSGKAARRKELRDEFYKYEEERKALALSEADERASTDATDGNNEDFEILEEVVEEIVSVEREVDKSRRQLTSEDERD